MSDCGMLDPFKCGKLPLDAWMTTGLRWLVDNYRPFFQSIKAPFDLILQWFGSLLSIIPPSVFIILVALVAWQFGGRRLASVLTVSLIFLGAVGVWQEAMTTLSIVLTSLVVAIALGLPLGIWAARSERAFSIMRPVLDGMQTIPAFV